MAKQTGQVSAWVKTEATVEAVDKGDILDPLRKVQKQYRLRAEKHELNGRPDLAAFYREQEINIGRLLGDSPALEVTNG